MVVPRWRVGLKWGTKVRPGPRWRSGLRCGYGWPSLALRAGMWLGVCLAGASGWNGEGLRAKLGVVGLGEGRLRGYVVRPITNYLSFPYYFFYFLEIAC